MPIIPAPVVTFPTADEATPINKTLAVANTAEDLATVPSLKTGRSISLVNEGPGHAYIAFDADATTADILVKKGDAFYEDNLEIVTKVSFIGELGKQPNIRGVLFSGV